MCPKGAHIYPSYGGNYYHDYLIWDHLAEVPEYGPLYSTRLWNYGAGESVFPPKGMQEMDLDPSTPFVDEWVRLAARNVTWDYKRHPEYGEEYAKLPYPERCHLVMLQPVPYLEAGWYEPPKWRAPQQHGYNMCPLQAEAGVVTVELGGFVDPERESDWRGMLVAVEADGAPR